MKLFCLATWNPRTSSMCGKPAGKPWSGDGEENSRNKVGIAQIW